MPVTDVNSYVTEFERFDEAHGASSPSWLRAMRQKAMTRFTALGFPTTRQEEWRFTSVAPIAERVFRLSVDGGEGLRKEHLKPYRFATSDVLEIVFVNGRFAPQLSAVDHLPAGVSVRHLADVLSHDPGRVAAHLARHADFESQPFAALNTAFLSDGAFIEIAPNAVIGPPVHIIFVSVSAGEVSHPRVLVLAGRNSQVRLVESQTRWEDVQSGSSRTGQKTWISGLVGPACYSAPADVWRELVPWLLWGEIAQVGKDTSKGNGVFRLKIV